MINKRGLSNLVATVLIVLLALAAVAIVWGFLRPMFTDTGTEVNLRSQCFSVDVQPVICTYSNNLTNGSYLDVTARARNMAGDAAQVSGVIDRVDGATQAENTQSAGTLLGTVTFDFGVHGSVDVSADAPTTEEEYALFDDFTVAGIVSDDAGNSEACSGETIACTYLPKCSPNLCGLCADSIDCGLASCAWSAGVCS
ncbi:MAG: hypothetical protein ABH864_04885 [archaeon]